MKKIVKQCIMCNTEVEIIVTDEQAKELIQLNRRNIQDILPHHSPAEREIFISGICSKCFNEIYGEDAEDRGVQ